MSIKLKVLGLGLLAVLATSAFAVMNASATTPAGSHFVSEATEHHLIVKGSDSFGTAHSLKFQGTSGAPISCTKATYHGTLAGATPPAVAPATTSQAIQIRPHYTECGTEGGTWNEITVHVPSTCGTNVYEFTSGTNGTIHVNCDITITHPNCTIKVPKQTITATKLHYNTDTRNNKHSITLDLDAHVTSHYEGGICVFLGTSHTSTMSGTSTVWGENTAGGAVGVTHT